MRDSTQKYYLCRSGEVKRRAEEYRKTFMRLRAKLWKVAESFGCDRMSLCDTMMLIRGLCFKGEPPSGWTKPKHGISYPKRGTVPMALRQYFTPSGSYILEAHSELKPFREWLGFPSSYSYTAEDYSGSRCIGRLFSDGFAFWYDASGPIMLEIPDVAGEKRAAKARGESVVGNVLDWTPPKGLKEVLREEWELMVAKHKQKTEGLKP